MDCEQAGPPSADELVAPNRGGRTLDNAADLLRRSPAAPHCIYGHRQRLSPRSQPFNDFGELFTVLEIVIVVDHDIRIPPFSLSRQLNPS